MGAAEQAPKRLAQFTRADLVEVRPVDWLIEGWVATDSLAGIVGPSGCCKSFLAVDWACRVATGTSWCGHAVKRGAAFILAGEGRNGLRKRIEGWSVHNRVSIEGAPLYLASNLPAMTDQVNTAAVIAEIESMADHLMFEHGGAEPALIVIDTVARALAGQNENSAEHMGNLVTCMDWLREQWGSAVLMIHHTGHDNTGRARGSSSYRAALDSELVMKPAGPDAVTLLPTKCKEWVPPTAMRLKRQSVPVTIPGADASSSTLVLLDNGKVEATVDRAQVVRDLQAQGYGVREIASQSGIPRSTVSRLLKEEPAKTWRGDFEPDF